MRHSARASTSRGVSVLAVGLLAVLYPLTMGRELGWPIWVYAAMAAGVVVLGVLRAVAVGPSARVASRWWRSASTGGRAFAAGSAMNSLLFVAMGSYFLCQTIYLQAGSRLVGAQGRARRSAVRADDDRLRRRRRGGAGAEDRPHGCSRSGR